MRYGEIQVGDIGSGTSGNVTTIGDFTTVKHNNSHRSHFVCTFNTPISNTNYNVLVEKISLNDIENDGDLKSHVVYNKSTTGFTISQDESESTVQDLQFNVRIESTVTTAANIIDDIENDASTTSIATSQAVKDYVDSNSGEGTGGFGGVAYLYHPSLTINSSQRVTGYTVYDSDNIITESNGIITLPNSGNYFVTFEGAYYSNSDGDYYQVEYKKNASVILSSFVTSSSNKNLYFPFSATAGDTLEINVEKLVTTVATAVATDVHITIVKMH